MQKSIIVSLALVCAFFASFLTYRSSEFKEVSYAIAICVFLIVSFYSGISFRNSRLVSWFCVAYVLVLATSVVVNINSFASFPIQSFLYPLIFFLISGSLWKIFLIHGSAAVFLLSIFVANGFFALLGVIGISEIYGIGPITQGRAIFFTSLPSSGGLISNVNYYAATQAVGFWLLYFMLIRGVISWNMRWLVYFVAFSVILGSSRSSTLVLIGSFVLFIFFESKLKIRVLILIVSCFVISSIFVLYEFALNDDNLNVGLRLYKGLNNRDDLWGVGVNLASSSMFFGYGSPQVYQREMLLAGASTTTVQNTILSMLLMCGIGGVIFFMSSVLMAFFRFITWKDRRKEDSAVVALLFFVVGDSFVRSYIPGGVGPLPFLMTASIVYLLRRGKL